MHSSRNLIKRIQSRSVKRNYLSVLIAAAGSVILITLLGAIGLAGCYVFLEPSLPSVDAMRNVEMQVPLRVYTRDGDLIAQIGEQRRLPVTWEQIPELVKHAFLAAEDDRFFQHHGPAGGAAAVPDPGQNLATQARGGLPHLPHGARILQAGDLRAVSERGV